MSLRLSKSLNPGAEEWRPTKILQYDRTPNSLLLRRIMYAPPSACSAPMAEPVVAYPAEMAAYPSYFHPVQYCYLPPSSPLKPLPVANGFCHERVAKPLGNGDKEIDGKRKVDKVDVMKEVATKNCPPRFRRRGRPFCFLGKSSPKLDWRPTKLVRPKTRIPGVDSPPPASTCSAPLTADISPSNTTVMIKNIPNQLRRDYMLNFLDHYCSKFSLAYDFMYLPMDFRRRDNLGYGFVNFTTAVAAMKFMEVLQNFKWECFQTERGTFTSKKICEITWAKIQGKEGYVRRFQHYNFACDQLEFLPVLLDPPRDGSDPNPNLPVILGNLMPPRFLRKNQY